MGPASSASERSLPDSRTREILSAQTRLLYENANLGVGVTIVAAILLGSLQWAVIPRPVIFVWWAYMAIVSLGRRALARRYHRASPEDRSSQKWSKVFAIAAGLSGVGWGGAGGLLHPADHLTNQVFVIFVLGGMMLGAATVLSPRPEAYLAFLV